LDSKPTVSDLQSALIRLSLLSVADLLGRTLRSARFVRHTGFMVSGAFA
jgi:hypothetical protein